MRTRKGVIFLWLTLVAASVIILFAFVFGILDFSKLPGKSPNQVIDQSAQDPGTLSGSDEVESIEEDLNNTDLDSLDEGLDQVGQDSGSL